MWKTTTFMQRYSWLANLLTLFGNPPGFPRILHKSDLEPCHIIQGTEHYLDKAGTSGYFKSLSDLGPLIQKHPTLPDCYFIGTEYLRVPDLHTSKYLRSLGVVFRHRCTRDADGRWNLLF